MRRSAQKKERNLLGLQDLEILEEIQILSAEELTCRAAFQKELLDRYEANELYWFSRYSENWLLKQDNNTEFFHRVANHTANGKKRKILFLD
jgi:hypothetical protein